MLLALLLIGATGYVLVEGWSWRDALFMAVITVSTVGYGEVRPLSAQGEILSMVLILMGVGAAAYSFSALADYVVAGELYGTVQKRRMKRTIGSLRSHYIVCGYGRVGRQVVESLRHGGLDVVVIDAEPGIAGPLDAEGVPYLIGRATADEMLQQAGIGHARGLCSCLPSDADNVFVVLSARALNPGLTIIARSNLMESAHKLRVAGANQVINPYLITGRRMAALLVHPNVVEFLDVVTEQGELELRIAELTIGVGSQLDGKTLGEGKVRSETGVNVLAVRRANGSLQTNLDAGFALVVGDTLIGLGTSEQLMRLAERTREQRQ